MIFFDKLIGIQKDHTGKEINIQSLIVFHYFNFLPSGVVVNLQSVMHEEASSNPGQGCLALLSTKLSRFLGLINTVTSRLQCKGKQNVGPAPHFPSECKWQVGTSPVYPSVQNFYFDIEISQKHGASLLQLNVVANHLRRCRQPRLSATTSDAVVQRDCRQPRLSATTSDAVVQRDCQQTTPDAVVQRDCQQTTPDAVVQRDCQQTTSDAVVQPAVKKQKQEN